MQGTPRGTEENMIPQINTDSWVSASEEKDASLLKISILPVEWGVEAILLSKNHVLPTLLLKRLQNLRPFAFQIPKMF